MKKFLLAALAAILLFSVPAGAQTQQPPFARVDGDFIASRYNWGFGAVKITNTIAAGTATVIMNAPSVTLPDGSTIYPFAVTAPITIDQGTSVSETVTPTAVSGCAGNAPNGTCSVTASFANAHASGASITSGTFGLEEAINDAAGFNGAGLISAQGGAVVVDKSWPGTTSQIQGTAAGSVAGATPTGNVVPMSNVIILDKRNGPPVVWSPIGGATTLAAPTTLVAATAGFSVAGANLTGGFYTGSNTYITSIACVDIMGQEGPGSASFTIATSGAATTDQIGFTAPAAQTGCVGYTIYITLNGGSYVSAYKVPLVTQPTVVGVAPVSNGVCTLTTLETVTPACAVTNATYGQTGSAAIVSALTLNTSPIVPAITTVSSTTIYTPNAGGRTTVVYSPGSRMGLPGIQGAFLPFVISAAEASTVPDVLGTINVAPGAMNAVGRTLEVCGKATTTASTATIVSIQFQWDSMGQNTAGKGVQIGNLGITPATAFSTTKVLTFCEDFQTTVAAATATGGSINTIGGYLNTSGVATAAAGQGAGSDPTIATVGSLNLAADARLNVVSVHTTGTDGAALTLQSLTARVF
jgi:hypothetical protein